MDSYIYILIFLLIICPLRCEKCETNLDCKESACCRNDECSDSSECIKINKIVYGTIGGVGFISLVFIFIHFFCTIRKTVKEIKDSMKLLKYSSPEMKEIINKKLDNLMN